MSTLIQCLTRQALCGICSILFFLPLPTLAAANTLSNEMPLLLKSEGLQGAVWATVDSDGTVVTGAAGIKDARTGAGMNPNDRVQIGSVTKTLLSTGVLHLVSQGRLALETPVSQLLPDVVFENPWGATDPIRVRHLLDHTSGLDDARFSQIFSMKPGPDTPLTQAFDRGGSLLRIRSRPGAHCSYSNMGYALLGRVIEAVTKDRYEHYLNTHLLRPLGMHDSTFSFVTQTGRHGDLRLAMGHFENGVTQAALPIYLRPAGQFTTTAADMGKFASFLMGDGTIDGRPFISRHLLDAMGRPDGTDASRGGLQVGFGLGLATRDRHGAIGKCHGGSVLGYRAMFCLFPERQRAYFISLNADSETADYGRFDALMVNALMLGPASPAPALGVPIDTAAWEGFYVPAPNRFASMAWFDTVFNFAMLRKQDTGLRFKSFQKSEVGLIQVSGALFRANGRESASHVLLTANTGERAISTGTQSFVKVPILKLASLWFSLLAGLLGLAYILVSGTIRLSKRRMSVSDPLFVAFAGAVALLLPLPLFYCQSFLRLGELTAASGALAAVTLALPLATMVGLAIGVRQWRSRAPDLVAMLGLLQWAAVLAVWDLVPFRLWL